jgi:hypothetical protein
MLRSMLANSESIFLSQREHLRRIQLASSDKMLQQVDSDARGGMRVPDDNPGE